MLKNPIYDTGIDYHYKKFGAPQSDRIYLTVKGAPMTYTGGKFHYVNSIIGSKHGPFVKLNNY